MPKYRQGKKKTRVPYDVNKKGGNSGKQQQAGDQTTEESLGSDVCCAVCCKKIVEQSTHNSGEEAVFCEGQCKSWLHRQCAGLTVPIFASITNMDASTPFLCIYCAFLKQSGDLAELKSSITKLTQELADIRRLSPKPSSKAQHSTSPYVHQPPAQKSTRPFSISNSSQQNQQNRKNNVIVYGISECSADLSRLQRIKKDLDATTALFNKIDADISRASIQECFRLGRFKGNSSRPRPILAKLNSTDVISLLAYRGEFPEGVKIKPDLSPQERLCESLLLKERWKLIQGGTDRKQIKIRKTRLIVSDKVHAEVVDNELQYTNEGSPATMDIENPSGKGTENCNSQPKETSA